jgi:hypothetical protein
MNIRLINILYPVRVHFPGTNIKHQTSQKSALIAVHNFSRSSELAQLEGHAVENRPSLVRAAEAAKSHRERGSKEISGDFQRTNPQKEQSEELLVLTGTQTALLVPH